MRHELIAIALLLVAAVHASIRPSQSQTMLSLPPLPFTKYATTATIRHSPGDVQTAQVRVDLTATIATVCTLSSYTTSGAKTTYASALDNFDNRTAKRRTVSLTSGVERCQSTNLTAPMPAGGSTLLAPEANSTVVSVANATVNGIACWVFRLKTPSGFSQDWTVTAATPHTPVSLSTSVDGSWRADTNFTEYESISDVGAQCAPARFECSTVRCVANPAVSASDLQSSLSWVCGVVSCAGIQSGGEFYFPNTPIAHASYAFQQYYLAHRTQGSSACAFNGNAILTTCDNDASLTCAVAQNAGEEALQTALAWLCGPEALQDCAPIKPSGAHFLPNTTKAHAGWAFNKYFQAYRCIPGFDACDFQGLATLVHP
jgi:hypothetical protein